MLILSNSTDAIEVVLSEAITTNQLTCVASWRDVEASTSVFTPGRTRINTNNTTDVDIVTGPSVADPQPARVIDFLSVYNNDTVGHTVTISYDENGTEAILIKVNLGPKDRVEYNDRQGFNVVACNGSIKKYTAKGLPDITTDNVMYFQYLDQDVANADSTANTMYDIPGLSFPVEKGQRYWFRIMIPFTVNATTTGTRFSVITPNAFGELKFRNTWSSGTGSRSLNEGWNNVFDVPSSSGTAVAATGSNMADIEGFCQFNENGYVTARFAAEVNTGTVTAKAGAVIMWIPVT